MKDGGKAEKWFAQDHVGRACRARSGSQAVGHCISTCPNPLCKQLWTLNHSLSFRELKHNSPLRSCPVLQGYRHGYQAKVTSTVKMGVITAVPPRTRSSPEHGACSSKALRKGGLPHLSGFMQNVTLNCTDTEDWRKHPLPAEPDTTAPPPAKGSPVFCSYTRFTWEAKNNGTPPVLCVHKNTQQIQEHAREVSIFWRLKELSHNETVFIFQTE